jgi:hypothetical protein
METDFEKTTPVWLEALKHARGAGIHARFARNDAAAFSAAGITG